MFFFSTKTESNLSDEEHHEMSTLLNYVRRFSLFTLINGPKNKTSWIFADHQISAQHAFGN